MIDIILIALLVFGVLLAILNIIRKRKFGSCCGNCGGCSIDSNCKCDTNLGACGCNTKNCDCQSDNKNKFTKFKQS